MHDGRRWQLVLQRGVFFPFPFFFFLEKTNLLCNVFRVQIYFDSMRLLVELPS